MGKIQIGDTFTVGGRFKKRTFFQWLFRCNKEINGLQRFKVVCDNETNIMSEVKDG